MRALSAGIYDDSVMKRKSSQIANNTYSIIGNTFSTKFVLVFGKGNTSSIASKVLCGIGNKGAPSTTNVKKSIKDRFSSDQLDTTV